MSIEKSNDMNQRNSELNNWIKTIGDENTRTYIEIRLIPQMDYYSRASRKFKKKYMWCKTMIIIFGALIPVAALFADYGILAKAVIAALGASGRKKAVLYTYPGEMVFGQQKTKPR